MSEIKRRLTGPNVVHLTPDCGAMRDGLEFGAHEVHHDLHSGRVLWVYFEYIGPRRVLSKLPSVDSSFFKVGKSGAKTFTDQFGRRVDVKRYADDVWRLWFMTRAEEKNQPTTAELDAIDVGPLLERFGAVACDPDLPRYRAFEMLIDQEKERQRHRVGRYSGPAAKS